MPFPILFGTTVTTVLHYRADCDMDVILPIKHVLKMPRPSVVETHNDCQATCFHVNC